MDILVKTLLKDKDTKTKIDKKGVQKVCLMYFKVPVSNVSAEKNTLKLGLNTTEFYGDHYEGSKTKLK